MEICELTICDLKIIYLEPKIYRSEYGEFIIYQWQGAEIAISPFIIQTTDQGVE
jgi:hypothetical protein